MLAELLNQARAGQPLWLPDLREAFAAAEGNRLILSLRSFDGYTRDYAHTLPRWQDADERALVRDYLCATVYNTMSVCGGSELTIFADTADAAVMGLLGDLPDIFQLTDKTRYGLGKVVSVANRMGRAFGLGDFQLRIRPVGEYAPVPNAEKQSGGLADKLRALCAAAEGTNCVGIDVGGTDIKLAASTNGRLAAVKEYDWNPASFPTAEQLINPILLLTRLLRACVAVPNDPRLTRALRKDATDTEMAEAVAAVEAEHECNVLDAVGVSFPDIVLRDRIVGGETPKTDGMRRNRERDYEMEFARLGRLNEQLLSLCRGTGRCRIINDGGMAAFTAAVEYACGDDPASVDRGVVAHSLGTDLGTGWLGIDGAIPQLPMELYDAWVDLGSAPAAALPPEDLRAIRNENSGLPGARRYLGQAAAYRLACERDPRLLDGFTEECDGALRIRTSPEDLRKPCLEHLLQKAGEGDANAEEVFRQIGRHLAVVSRELDYLLHPETSVRVLYGRFIKSERCFALLREGFAETVPQMRLESGGEGLANTPLMRRLAARRDVTVAQFAQAVGAIYYAMT